MEFIIASFMVGGLVILGVYLYNTVYLPYAVKKAEYLKREAIAKEEAQRWWDAHMEADRKERAEKKRQIPNSEHKISLPTFKKPGPIMETMSLRELERQEGRRQLEENEATNRRLQQEANLRAAKRIEHEKSLRAHLPNVRLNPKTGQWESVDHQCEIMGRSAKDILKKGY